MNRTVLSTITSLATVLIGTVILWLATSGFSAFTEESARRMEVMNNPKEISPFQFENQDGVRANFNHINQSIVIADFIYTRCPTFCQTMGSEFTLVQNVIKEAGLAEQVALLSISFDAKNDTPEAMTAYLQRYKADKKIWQSVRITEESKETLLLEEFGVTVIPDQYGEYVHNAAFYLIQDNAIQRIFDYTDHESLLAEVSNRLGGHEK